MISFLLRSIKCRFIKMTIIFCDLQEGKETLSSVNATGLAMLFSAGTFLYVATVHVLPELMTRTSTNYSHLPTSESGSSSSSFGLKFKEIIALVFGCFLPALITTGHHH